MQTCYFNVVVFLVLHLNHKQTFLKNKAYFDAYFRLGWVKVWNPLLGYYRVRIVYLRVSPPHGLEIFLYSSNKVLKPVFKCHTLMIDFENISVQCFRISRKMCWKLNSYQETNWQIVDRWLEVTLEKVLCRKIFLH